MPIASLVLGGVAFLFMLGGFFLTAVPVAGSVLSFGAPLLSLAGIVLAGMSMSQAKSQGESNGVAIAGLVMNIVAFLLSLLVALTCGLCNACLTGAEMNRDSATQSADPMGQALGNQLAASMSRISVSMKLSAMKMGCATDPSGTQAMQQFHSAVAGQYQAVACQVGEPLIEAVSRSCDEGTHPCASASVVAGTADATRATALGLDPQQCYAYTSGTAKVIGCNDEKNGQFQLIHLENPAGAN